MDKKLKAAESRIGELLGDSIKNHREEYEFLDWVGDEVDKLLAENAALKSQLAGVGKIWGKKYSGQMYLGTGHALTDKPASVQALHLVDAGKLNKILSSPSHTCPGCEDLRSQLFATNASHKHTTACYDRLDKRMGEAREAWGEIREEYLTISGWPSKIVNDMDVALSAKTFDNPSGTYTALNGGDSFLSGNPHHLGTDTALNGKEGEDG